MFTLASVTQLRKEIERKGEGGVSLGTQSALQRGNAAGAQRRPGKKTPDGDRGYAYIREPTPKGTSEVMESRGLF